MALNPMMMSPQMLHSMLTDPRATPEQRMTAVSMLGGGQGGGAPQPQAAPQTGLNIAAALGTGSKAAGGMPDEGGGAGMGGMGSDGGSGDGDIPFTPEFMAMVKHAVQNEDTPLSGEDKGLALAQAGFGMAASGAHTFGQSVGQGAVYGIQGLQELKKQRAMERMRRDAMTQAGQLQSERLMESHRAATEREQIQRDQIQQREDAAKQAALDRAAALDARGDQAAVNAGIRQQLADAAAERAAAATAAAPTGVTSVDPMQAKSVGIPVDGIPNPYVKVSKKAQEEIYKTNEKLFETEQAKLGANDQVNAQVKGDLDRFKELNALDITGPSKGIPVLGWVQKAASPELQEMDSITNRLAPVFRNGLPGSASNLDVKMFKGSGPEVTKDKTVNDNRIDAMSAAMQNATDYTQYKRDFFSVHHHLEGADKSWKQYLEANPIFDHTKGAAPYTLNANRKSYKQWFGGDESDAAPDTGAIEFVRDPTTGALRRK